MEIFKCAEVNINYIFEGENVVSKHDSDFNFIKTESMFKHVKHHEYILQLSEDRDEVNELISRARDIGVSESLQKNIKDAMIKKCTFILFFAG